MTLKKFALTIVIGALLMTIGIAIVAAQGKQPDQCSDPSFLTLPDDPPIAMLEEVPTPIGVYSLWLVHRTDGQIGLFVAHLDPQTGQFTGDGFVVRDAAPSLLLPVTTLSWDQVEVKVALCDGTLKWHFAIVESPSPEATPEATPQSGS